MRANGTHILFALLLALPLLSTNAEALTLPEPEIIITETDGKDFASGPFIKRFVLGDAGGDRNDPQNYGHPTSFSLADPDEATRGIFARKSWDEGAYGGQGALIARKLLAFGTEDDVRLVRESLLTASINADGFVDTAQSKRWHLGGQKATLESNAEYVLMAWAYLVHTGDEALFHAPISRIVCVKDAQNVWHSVVHQNPSTFDCLRTINQDRNSPSDFRNINSTVYYEYVRASNFNPNIDTGLFNNPGRILGQLVHVLFPFKSIRLPVAKRSAQKLWPFRVYLVNNDTAQTIFDHIFDAAGVQNSGWLEIELPNLQPEGHYNIEIHPVRDDSRSDQIDSYWWSIGWLNDVGPQLLAGATTKLYWDDPFIDSQHWTIASKVEQAFNWALRRSLRNTGKLGIFINPFSHLRGTGEQGISSSSYYDLFKSGYKDSYSILRYIESLSAYADLQSAHVTRQQVSLTDIANVKADFYKQMVDSSSGNVMSWIGCSSYADAFTPLCDPTAVVDFTIQHPYDVGFLPPQALAAQLLNDQGQYPEIETRLASQRMDSRMLSGEFRTNTIHVERVTAGIWYANAGWNVKIGNYPNGLFWARYSFPNRAGEETWDFSQTGDWHLFDNGKGNGNFGNQENNGGVLLSTTAFVFEAGPYPEIYSDWETFVTKMNLISAWLKQGSGGRGLFSDYLRKPLQDPFVKWLCQRARGLVSAGTTAPAPDTPTDGFGEQWCDYYKSVSYNLPENGAVAHSFVSGLLSLKLRPQGLATIFGQPFIFNKRNSAGQFFPQNLPMSQPQTASWPPEVETVTVSGFRFHGRVVTLTCARTNSGLSCTES